MNYIALLDYEHLDNALFLKAFAGALAAQKQTRGIILHGDSPYTDRLMQTGMMRADARLRAVRELNHRLVALLADSGVATAGMNAYQRGAVCVTGPGGLSASMPSSPGTSDTRSGETYGEPRNRGTEDRRISGQVYARSSGRETLQGSQGVKKYLNTAPKLDIDSRFLAGFPAGTHLVLSNLVEAGTGTPLFYDLPALSQAIYRRLDLDEILIFSKNETGGVPGGSAHPEFTDVKKPDENFRRAELPDDMQHIDFSFRLTRLEGFRRLPDTKSTLLIS